MKCPRDSFELKSDDFVGHPISRCSDCRGYLIPFEVLEEVGTNFSQNIIPHLERKIQSREISKGKLACTSCSEPFYCSEFKSIELDFCLDCKVFWIDYHELDPSLYPESLGVTDYIGVLVIAVIHQWVINLART